MTTQSADARILAGLVTSLAGAATTFGVAVANLLLINRLGHDLLSFSVLFIIPVGALVGGAAAASGYYGAARLTQTMPSNWLVLQMPVVGLSAWVFSHWIVYATTVLDDGRSLRDLVSFFENWQWNATHQSLNITVHGHTSGSTGELGTLGYVREALQAVGFIFGAFATFGFLASVERCNECRKYARVNRILRGVAVEAFDSVLQNSGVALPGIGEDARLNSGAKAIDSLHLDECLCPQCGRLWIRPTLVVGAGHSMTEVKLRQYNVDKTIIASLRRAAALPRTSPRKEVSQKPEKLAP
jgi:hypothetical protein